MAVAGATISSCFSTLINSKHVSSSNIVFSINCTRTLQVASISHGHLVDSLSNKWRNVRIAASVIQEELAGAVEVGNVEEVVEEKEVGEELSEVEVEVEVEDEVAVEAPAEIEVPSNTKLYFGNLPYNCDSAQLAGIIQDYASPELVEVLYDRTTGKSRGFAFVTMSSIEDCNTVLQNLDGSVSNFYYLYMISLSVPILLTCKCIFYPLKGLIELYFQLYGGRTLRVNFADKPKPKTPLYPETEYKLFVGNLSWTVTNEILNEAFQGHGTVVGARVLYDGDTGQSRGYGFVCYATREEMEVALNSLNGVELEGRAMRVSLAQGKR
ncbi:hypothetical protein IFM89_010523 [Coptis chinensis]|uniref:RRM domain-containing protein n=1 Tax=Coptis chinensis TaxID=261450 RepID=A0A835HV32_9MAGN|nr:hypothetical protein IFM89_010523 [Coptis chinensis]